MIQVEATTRGREAQVDQRVKVLGLDVCRTALSQLSAIKRPQLQAKRLNDHVAEERVVLLKPHHQVEDPLHEVVR